jgi:hypothetical protein
VNISEAEAIAAKDLKISKSALEFITNAASRLEDQDIFTQFSELMEDPPPMISEPPAPIFAAYYEVPPQAPGNTSPLYKPESPKYQPSSPPYMPSATPEYNPEDVPKDEYNPEENVPQPEAYNPEENVPKAEEYDPAKNYYEKSLEERLQNARNIVHTWSETPERGIKIHTMERSTTSKPASPRPEPKVEPVKFHAGWGALAESPKRK